MLEKKRAKQFFQKHTNSASKKCRKKSTGKSAKKRFLYSHEYRDPKRGEKSAKHVFQKHTNSACKKCSEKNVGIMGKNVFYILTNIVTKKGGGGKACNNFSRNSRIVLAKNFWKNIVGKKGETTFFIFTRIS